MAKKPTVVDLLQKIVDILEGKPLMYGPEPKPAPRVINDHFTDNRDGTISDNENKTIIIKDPSKIPALEKALTFKEAKEACETLCYAGYNGGWRMPTLKEEQSIRDYTKYDPAWDKDIFGGKYDDWYWTSTECAWNKDAAWCVPSGGGYVYDDVEDGRSYVRPVRSQ